MAKYNIHAGHCPQGKGASGAVGYLKESVEDRKVKGEVIRLLRAAGHTAYDCTCDKKTDQNGCLRYIVAKCNAHTVARDVSIHLNSGGGTGVEVLVVSKNSKAYKEATRISAKIARALGIRDRGVKIRPELYVLRHTNAPALLVECCFVDNKTDYHAWDYKKCARAIAEGLIGKKIEKKPAAKKAADKSFKVKTKQALNIYKSPGKDYTGKKAPESVYTITETKTVEKMPYGRLRSSEGWIKISSKYAETL